MFLLLVILAPKGILNKIREIYRKFMWNGAEEKNKWALVSWDKIFNPKSLGGLDLLDPEKMSVVCGAKLWWQWIKDVNLP